MCFQLHAPDSLPPWKETSVAIGQEAGQSQSQPGRRGVQKNLLPLLEIEPRPSSP
jgi:hypothetical protein